MMDDDDKPPLPDRSKQHEAPSKPVERELTLTELMWLTREQPKRVL
jgi:hypothetical protein